MEKMELSLTNVHCNEFDKNRSLSVREIIIIFSVIFFSGHGLLAFYQTIYFNLYYAIILYLIAKPRIKINNLQLLLMMYLPIVAVLQDIVFIGSPVQSNIVHQLLKVFIPLVVFNSLKVRFIDSYLTVMNYINITSLFIYLLLLIFPALGSLFVKYGKAWDYDTVYHTFIYSYSLPRLREYQVIDRLFGIFSEPGRYAIFLIVGLIFYYIRDKKIISFGGVVALTCLLLTQSTAGYIALFFLLIYVAFQQRSIVKTGVLLMLFIPMVIYIYQTPFMKDKIEINIEMADTYQHHARGRGRVSAMVHSVNFFRRNWLIGKGLTHESQQTISYEEESGSSILYLGGQLGVLGLLLYIYGLYIFLKRIQQENKVVNSGLVATLLLVLSITVVFTSQQVSSMQPFMMCLVIYGLGLHNTDNCKKIIYDQKDRIMIPEY